MSFFYRHSESSLASKIARFFTSMDRDIFWLSLEFNGENHGCSDPYFFFNESHISREHCQLKSSLVGGLEHFYFPIYWVSNHPNWRTHIFSEGWPWPTNQKIFSFQIYLLQPRRSIIHHMRHLRVSCTPWCHQWGCLQSHDSGQMLEVEDLVSGGAPYFRFPRCNPWSRWMR